MSWQIPLQTASYRGVDFEVQSVSDNFERSLVEHAYPFLNGADLEDMGLGVRTVQMQAVFFGENYYESLTRFLEAITKLGDDVLIHPLLGRLPNMMLASTTIRHEADYINYAALDLTFKESIPSQPIFVFEESALTQVDSLLNDVEGLLEDGLSFLESLIQALNFISNAFDRWQAFWASIYGIYWQLVELFGLDKNKYRLSATSPNNKTAFKEQVINAAKQINEMIEEGLNEVADRSTLTVRAGFDEVLRTVNQIKLLPRNLVTGRSDKALSASYFMRQVLNAKTSSGQSSGTVSRLTATVSGIGSNSTQFYQDRRLGGLERLKLSQIKQADCLMRLVCAIHLMRLGVEIIEDEEETLLPSEVEYINHQVRTAIADAINSIRALQQEDLAVKNVAQPNTAIYNRSYQMIEGLRKTAHKMNLLTIAVINRKPPLVVRESGVSGTIHQVAHDFYGNYKRADELLRLNPHIRLPIFINRGDLLNAYAK